VPAGVNVKVVENTQEELYITLPLPPTGELSDAQLEGAAGGAITMAASFQLSATAFRRFVSIVQTQSGGNGSTCYKDCIPW
jgi:hypothetical protein